MRDNATRIKWQHQELINTVEYSPMGGEPSPHAGYDLMEKTKMINGRSPTITW